MREHADGADREGDCPAVDVVALFERQQSSDSTGSRNASRAAAESERHVGIEIAPASPHFGWSAELAIVASSNPGLRPTHLSRSPAHGIGFWHLWRPGPGEPR